uniref:G_PROTEIN_RECEP_F1_2 domain-containing protein n=1 Tax=Haemonchus placei TaxID=6290 RepID=A0A0N4X0N9_HAEPC
LKYPPNFTLLTSLRSTRSTPSTYPPIHCFTYKKEIYLFQALTLQAILPIFCYLPTSLMAAFVRTFKTEVVFIEYLMLSFGALPSVIDPLITIYFVPSYRKWLTEKYHKRSILTKVLRLSTIKNPQNPVLKVRVINAPATIAQH